MNILLKYGITFTFILFLFNDIYSQDKTDNKDKALPGATCEAKPVIRLVQLCDPQLGFGDDGFDADVARLEQAVRQINALAPDMVIIAGDMVNDAGDDHAIAVFRKTIALLTPPVILTPGNHDLPDPVTTEGLKRYRSFFGKDFRTVECKGWRIISANSQLWREAPPKESKRHDKLLRKAMKKAKKKGQPVIMLTHVPPFVSAIDEADEYFNLPKAKREDLLRDSEECGVIIWLSGHIHKTSQRTYHNIAILNGETTSRNFDGHPTGFRLLTIYPDNRFDWEFVIVF